MPSLEFEKEVIEKLAKIEANTESQNRIVDGHGRTLYGRNGDEGLVKDITVLNGRLNQEMTVIKERQNWWNRGLALASIAIAGALAWLKGA